MCRWFRVAFPSVLAVALLCPAASVAEASDPDPLSVRVRFEEALGQVERLEDLSAQLKILDEAGASLRWADETVVRRLLAVIYRALMESPAELRAQSLGAGDNRGAASATGVSLNRDSLFRQFVRIVARFDAELAKSYADSYARKHDASQPVMDHWEAAYDLLYDNTAESIRLASVAAQTSGFPDIGLQYLERLRSTEPAAADSIAGMVMERMGGLSPNARLLLLSYVLPNPRVPLIIEGRLATRGDLDRGPLQSMAINPLLLEQFTGALLADGNAEPAVPHLLVLRLLEEAVRDKHPTLASALREKQKKLGQGLPADVIRSIDSEVTGWYGTTDELAHSIEIFEAAFDRSHDARFRDRATALRALSLARSGDFDGALALLTSLPVEARGNATDVVLLYAANAVKDYGRAHRLAALSRGETRNKFVTGYALLTAARLAPDDRGSAEEQRVALLEEVGEIAQQLGRPAERFSLQFGAATLWARHDASRAYIALAALLKEHASADPWEGRPFVHLALRVSGTTFEFKLPTGQSTLYGLVRTLAGADIEQTMAIVSGAPREDIRLRCIVAASTEYLSREMRKKGSDNRLRSRPGQ
jgi:tetratricopeptide (TPR) repeat protein